MSKYSGLPHMTIEQICQWAEQRVRDGENFFDVQRDIVDGFDLVWGSENARAIAEAAYRGSNLMKDRNSLYMEVQQLRGEQEQLMRENVKLRHALEAIVKKHYLKPNPGTCDDAQVHPDLIQQAKDALDR